ncbi:hypothetical protein [Sphingobium sp. YR768]|uniref:hypothetical protein n=1 Tax=Sphingobium sp. YR768 TaxID=1884365 RepID=UPI0015A6D5F5|nr:hypothetical protein [Sphingobium sp. YR768]
MCASLRHIENEGADGIALSVVLADDFHQPAALCLSDWSGRGEGAGENDHPILNINHATRLFEPVKPQVRVKAAVSAGLGFKPCQQCEDAEAGILP